MSKNAKCQLTRVENLKKSDYITALGGNIQIKDGFVSTLGTKQQICLNCLTTDVNRWFIKNSSWICQTEHQYNGEYSEKLYRMGATVRIKEYDMLNSLSVLTTKYLFSVITVNKNGVIRILSCKYRKFQKLSKVLDKLQEYFEVLDYGVDEFDENDGFVRHLTKDCKSWDTIKALQESRAKNQWTWAWISDREDKKVKLAE